MVVCTQLWRTNFEIDEAYTPIKAIGKGAYGVVCSAKLKDKEKVAIKKIGASRTERNGAGGRSQDQVHACIPQAK
jgi:serine/threonine protein kinase